MAADCTPNSMTTRTIKARDPETTGPSQITQDSAAQNSDDSNLFKVVSA